MWQKFELQNSRFCGATTSTSKYKTSQ